MEIDGLTILTVLMIVAALVLLVAILFASTHPLPETGAAQGQAEPAYMTYCPFCWRECRDDILRRFPEADPPEMLDGMEVVCGAHRLFHRYGLSSPLRPATDGPNDEYAEEFERGVWS